SVSFENTVSRWALTTISGDREAPLSNARQLPSSSISTPVRSISKNFLRRYSARSCSLNGLAGTEQMRICSSVIASAFVSNHCSARATSGDESNWLMVKDGEVFSADDI